MILQITFIALLTLFIYIYAVGLEHVLVKQRWVFVCFFLMPLSFIFGKWLLFRNWYVFKMCSAPKLHGERVRKIQNEIKKWNNEGRQKKLCTGRSGWQTVSLRVGKYKDTHHRVHIDLMDILNVDTHKKTVTVEPLVSMGQLSHALIPKGWTIPVLPELDMLTVGGLIMGCGVETSSHKYGLFQNICFSFDLVMADGSLIHCSVDENPELFYQIPWSHGTLGFLVAAELKIIPAKKYVKVTYEPIYDVETLCQKIQEESNKEENDFVEGLAYSVNESVLMTSLLTDYCEEDKLNVISNYWRPWFFEHVKKYLQAEQTAVEFIPLRDYYHRHTRSLFWELQDIVPFGNNVIFRYLLGWLMPPQIALLKITSPQIILDLYENKHVVQDMLVPINKLKESLECFDVKTKIYPLWLCPFKLFDKPGIVKPHENRDIMYIDIGAYGSPKVETFKGPATMREIEKFVIENKGYQMLYADSYLTKDEFYEMFDHKGYEILREKYRCDDALPTIYDKVNRKARR